MFSGLWFLSPRVIVVDQKFKDVTNQFDKSPDVFVHGRLALYILIMCVLFIVSFLFAVQSYDIRPQPLCSVLPCDTFLVFIYSSSVEGEFGL